MSKGRNVAGSWQTTWGRLRDWNSLQTSGSRATLVSERPFRLWRASSTDVLGRPTRIQATVQPHCKGDIGFSPTAAERFCCSVICPVSLIGQWAKEIEKMAVGLRVLEHHGQTRTDSTSIESSTCSLDLIGYSEPSKLQSNHIVVSNPNTSIQTIFILSTS